MIRFSNWVKSPSGKITKFKTNKAKAQKIFDKVKSEKRPNLLEEEGQEVLKAYGFVTKSTLATSNEAQSLKRLVISCNENCIPSDNS